MTPQKRKLLAIIGIVTLTYTNPRTGTVIEEKYDTLEKAQNRADYLYKIGYWK